MAISATAALWFLPFVLPICLYVAFTDMKQMRITNQAVLVLIAIFVVLGLFLLPFETYLWRLLSLVIVLVIGIVLNAAGVMGAGDAKFAAAEIHPPAPPRARLAKLAGNQEIPHGPRPWHHAGALSHSRGALRGLNADIAGTISFFAIDCPHSRHIQDLPSSLTERRRLPFQGTC